MRATNSCLLAGTASRRQAARALASSWSAVVASVRRAASVDAGARGRPGDADPAVILDAMAAGRRSGTTTPGLSRAERSVASRRSPERGEVSPPDRPADPPERLAGDGRGRTIAAAPAAVPLGAGAMPFGDLVDRRFPGVAYDIDEAARCLVQGRSTATVFHTMRIIVQGLDAYAAWRATLAHVAAPDA